MFYFRGFGAKEGDGEIISIEKFACARCFHVAAFVLVILGCAMRLYKLGRLFVTGEVTGVRAQPVRQPRVGKLGKRDGKQHALTDCSY